MDFCTICENVKTEKTLIDNLGNVFPVCERPACIADFERQKAAAKAARQRDEVGSQLDTDEKKEYRSRLTSIWKGEGGSNKLTPPERYLGADWDSLKQTQVTGFHQAAANFLSGRSQLLAFVGPKGRGKTWAAYGLMYGFLLHNFKKNNNEAEFITWSQLKILATKCSAYGPAGEKAEQELIRLSRVGLLIIDEFGLTKPLDGQLDQIHNLLDRRYVHMRNTLVTTTRNLAELEEMMGGGIVDRFSGGKTGGCILEFNGPNLRH